MKQLLSVLLLSLLTAKLMAGNWFGPGPWSDGAYYPGGLNGKYVGIVTGNNIAGVLGFAIADGAPPFRTVQQQTSSGGEFAPVALQNSSTRPDVLQNYFSIFVEGRTYSGLTLAGINIDDGTVAGSLQGTDPPALLAPTAPFATGIATTNITVTEVGTNIVVLTNVTREPAVFNNAISILSRGLSGGFTANIQKKQSVFTFKGTGQLSTPANPQTYTASGFVQAKLPLDPPLGSPAGSLTNISVTGSYQTATTPFNISGIRTSFIANNPAAIQDAQNASQQGGGGN